ATLRATRSPPEPSKAAAPRGGSLLACPFQRCISAAQGLSRSLWRGLGVSETAGHLTRSLGKEDSETTTSSSDARRRGNRRARWRRAAGWPSGRGASHWQRPVLHIPVGLGNLGHPRR